MKRLSVIIPFGLLALLGILAWSFDRVVAAPVATAGLKKTITVPAGAGVRQTADILVDQGFVKQRWHWNTYILVSGLRSSIRSGQFDLRGDMSLRQIATVLTSEPTNEREITVKVIEGMTAQEIAQILEDKKVTTVKEFMTAVTETPLGTLIPGTTYAILAGRPAGTGLEGFLFPDTYRFFRDSSASTVVKKFLDNFEAKFSAELQSATQANGHTVLDTVILASVVEAELKTDTDRAMAADLFWRRLKVGIPLQSDATVNYITGKGRLQPSIADTKVASPYNTYLHPGLPPGPIGNPSLSALRATAQPKANEYFYFLTTPTGQTVFSKTFDEHVANKQKYLSGS